MMTELTREEQIQKLSDQWAAGQKVKMHDLAVALINYKNAILADYAKFLKEIDGSVDKFAVEFEYGSKYVKIVTISGGGSRSVHSFVEKGDGNIWRAASWKAPAKNFVRGNVYITSSYEKRVQWTGIN